MESTAHRGFRVIQVGIIITPVKFTIARPLGSCWPASTGIRCTGARAGIGASRTGILQYVIVRFRIEPCPEQFTSHHTSGTARRISGHHRLLVPVSSLKTISVRNYQMKRAITVEFNIRKNGLLMSRNKSCIGIIAIVIGPAMPLARPGNK